MKPQPTALALAACLAATGLAVSSPAHAAVVTTGDVDTSGDPVVIGDTGDGGYTVNGGSDVDFGAVIVRVGVNAGVDGAVTVTGSGSSVANGSFSFIGDAGNGTLDVTSGGTFTTSRMIVSSQAGSTGAVVVDGGGSALLPAISVTVSTDGSLTVRNGGSFGQSGTVATLGVSGNTSAATITGSGATLFAGNLQLATAGESGVVTFSSGAAAEFIGPTHEIGFGAAADGDLNITGSGTTVDFTGNLFLGNLGGAGTLSMSTHAGASIAGNLNVRSTGDATLASGASLDVGGNVNSSGAVAVDSNATLTADAFNNDAGASLTLAGGTLTTTSGLTHDGATLSGYGTIAGPVTLNQDAAGGSGANTLTFTGEVTGVGDITGNSRFEGSYAPGASPAGVTLGSPTFAPSNTLVMELAGTTPATQHDQITVTGDATLGGALDVDLDSFTPTSGDTFDLVVTSGAGAIAGNFDSLLFPSVGGGAFFVSQNDGNTYQIAFGNPSISATGLSASAAGVQAALNNVFTSGSASGEVVAVANNVLNLDPADQPDALEALAAHSVSQAFEAPLHLTRTHLGQVRRRVSPGNDFAGSQVRLGTQTASAPRRDAGFAAEPRASFLDGGDADTADAGTGWNVFLLGGYEHFERDAVNGQAGYDGDSFGFTLGVDRVLADDATRLGFGFGYANADTDNASPGGGSDVRTYSALAFATHDLREDLRLAATVTLGHSQVDQDRQVIFAGFNRTAESDTDALVWAVDLGATYRAPVDRFELLPHAYLQYAGADVDGYTETGGGGANLTVDDFTSHSLVSTLGVELANTYDLGDATLRPSVRVGWDHQFLTDEESVAVSFAGDPSSRFTALAAAPVENALVFGAGLSVAPSDTLDLYADYRGSLGSEDSESHAVQAGVRLGF